MKGKVERLPSAEKIRAAVKAGGWTRPNRGRKDRLATLRQTVDLTPGLWEAIRRVAWWERRTRSDIVAQAVRELVARLEKERGEPYTPVEEPRKVKA